MAKSLYICYFGVREPLVQTQVVPYLRELAKGGHEMSLVTFEPNGFDQTAGEEEKVKTDLAEQGIDWHWLKYHKRFSVLATAWDIFQGTRFVRRFIADRRPDILHGRVHIPTLMGALSRKLSKCKPKLLFDIRGFFPEEYTDAGIWPENGWLYRSAKLVERWLLKQSDGFVVLTEKARDILFRESKESGYDKLGRPVEVIPCCVDLAKYENSTDDLRLKMRADLGLDGRFVVTYVGSFGGWYLTDEMIELFAASREFSPTAFALVLTQRDKGNVEKRLAERGFSSSDFLVASVRPDQVIYYLAAADAAISFIKACYSKQSSSPTKIAEYLASGLPIIANKGVGDIDDLIQSNQVGVMIDKFSNDSYLTAFRKIASLSDVRARSRRLSVSEFDLETVGGVRYRRIYQRLVIKQKE